MVGAPGIVRGITVSLELLGTESPAIFVATTFTVYDVPLLSPLHVALRVSVTVQVPPAGVVLTV